MRHVTSSQPHQDVAGKGRTPTSKLLRKAVTRKALHAVSPRHWCQQPLWVIHLHSGVATSLIQFQN